MPGQRIIIIGNSNSGKTTLGERIAGARRVPFIELDALHWEPNWTPAEPDLFRERVRDAIKAPAWVMAGNYSQRREISWPAADTVIWLDLPLQLVIRRILVRSWQRWRSKEMLWGTNYESFWNQLKLWSYDDSLITFTVVNHRKRRRNYPALMDAPEWSHLTFIRLTSPGEVDHWFREHFREP